jgi:hypothetical protein
MDEDDCLTLLGETWPTCDTVGRYLDDLFDALGENGPLLHMMDAEEKAMYGPLPDLIFRLNKVELVTLLRLLHIRACGRSAPGIR